MWTPLKRSLSASHSRLAGHESARRAFLLAERVRQLREARGLTQAELAHRMGTTQPFVARLEAGGAEPTLETLVRIARALDVQLVVDFRRPRRATA
jgi:transcriptional regulator with XRE-family HTH domain